MPSRRPSKQRIQAIRSRPHKARKPRPDTHVARQPNEPKDTADHTQQDLTRTAQAQSNLVPYNPRLLNRSRLQLQLGDWEKLADLDDHELEHNPAAAELQLLAAAGHLQKGGEQARSRARALIDSAMEAGLNRESVARLLIGGAFNSLGRLSVLIGRSDQKILAHFRSALSISDPDADISLVFQPMAARQLVLLASKTGSDAIHELARRTALSMALSESTIKDERHGDEPGSHSSLEPSAEDARHRLLNELVYRQKSRHIFLDCGGHDGCSAIKFLLMYPHFDVISFEPNPVFWAYYESLPTHLSKAAVSVEDGSSILIIDDVDGDGSSLMVEKQVDNTRARTNIDLPSIKVNCISLPKLIRDLRSRYDTIVLKLDIEGMEYPILEQMKVEKTLPMIDELYCEFHWMKMGYPKAQHDQLVDALKRVLVLHDWDALDFSVHGRKSQTLKKIRETLVRSLLNRASLSEVSSS